ncbi:MAG: YihA family ribosome biogenesis GTP-binding protein [Pyrinomonadaceae bacterium]|nr:YihA family ribosome biogenesis GTP-binding protein [Pyrinomonadaceae bacterium]
MKITSAEFVKSAFAEEHWTKDNLPEIAFLGRSNVGKSSLINSLLTRKGLARTSNTPGRTQSLNFFLINQKFHFVDLPGYGYAKVSKTMRAEWGKMAEEYLANRRQLVLFIQLVDSRHAPTELDKQLYEWLRHHEKHSIVVATKADKISSKELQTNLEVFKENLPDTEIIAFSATKKTGRDAVWEQIQSALKNRK